MISLTWLACLGRIEKGEDGKFTLHYQGEGKSEGSIVAGKVMFGTGRAPNTKEIGLEVSGPRPAVSLTSGVRFCQ